MTFERVLTPVIELLARQGWVSYQTLRRRFGLDEAALAALTQHLLATQPVTVDDTSTRLVWQGELRPATGPIRRVDVVSAAPAVPHWSPPHLVDEERHAVVPLVGRAQEVELLLARWAQVQAGQGQVVGLHGEAGIGKSRLVQVARASVAEFPHRCWMSRGVATAQYSAFYPVMDLLQQVMDAQPNDGPAVKLPKLEALLASCPGALPDAVPLLATLLAVPLDDRSPPLTLTPARQRQRMLETLLTVLRGLAVQQPVLLIMEDLHWVDPSTLELLGLLVAQAATARLYVLLTWRPEFQPPWPPLAHQTTLTLGRLLPAQVEQLATQVAGGKPLPPAVLEQLVAKTEGVPLFVEELTQMVLGSGLVREAGDHYALTGPLPPLALPPTVQASLVARLEQLGDAQAVAQVGAVWGRGFTEAQLQAVAPVDRRRLDQALARLVAADILRELPLPPRLTYVFKHALLQEAAYASLPPDRRQQVHGQVAQVLAERFPETVATQPELLAQHYMEAGRIAQAIPYWQRAGGRATQRSAYAEAVTCLEQALVALAQLPERRDLQEKAIEIRLALRTALLPFGEYGQILGHLREAETLAHVLDDRQRLVRVSVYMTEYFRQMSDFEHALESGQRAFAFATTLGEVGLQVIASYYLGLTYYDLGDYRRAVDCLGWNVASLRGDLRREHFGMTGLPFVLSCACLSWSLAELGLFTEGIAQGEAGVRIAEAADHPFSLINAYVGIGHVYLTQGDFPRGIPVLERGLRLCQACDIPSLFPTAARALGTAYALSGRVAEALPLLEQSAAQGRRSGRALWLAYLREAYLLAGSREDIGALAQRVLDLSREYKQRGYQAHALRLLGEIAAHCEPLDVDQAIAYYNQALTLAEELGMRPLQAHCHRGLGTLYAQTGQQEQACVALATALDFYRAMDMMFWLPETEATLAQVEGR